MTEISPLESRLLAAVRSIADRASTQVDAVAVAERAIQGRPAVGGSWLWRTVPVPVGVLVLAGLLALGLLGAVLVAGSWPNDRVSAIATCSAGSSPDEPGPSGQARPDGGTAAVVDRQSGLLVLHTDNEIWHFDLCTNTWRRSAAALPDDTYVGASVYDAGSDLVVSFSASKVFVYDTETESVRGAERPARGDRTRAVYDPVSDLIFVRDYERLWTYDVDLDAWQEVAQAGVRLPFTNEGVLLAYDASAERIVLYHVQGGWGQTYEFDPATSAWTRLILGSRRMAPEMRFWFGDLVAGGEIAYDEASARTIVFNQGRVIAYDATADSWELVFDSPMECWACAEPADPSHRGGARLAYDPVNHRILVVGGTRHSGSDSVGLDDVLAFDLATGTWIELLAPSSE
jgi:hypothetical protein